MNTIEKYNRTESFSADAPMCIDSVKIVWKDDSDADLSYLEDNDYSGLPQGEAENYAEKDKERLADYGSVWAMIGCYAEAVVSYPIGQGNRRLQTFRSGGLWGIESDSDATYKKSVESEELADLAGHLTAFGVPVTLPLEVTK